MKLTKKECEIAVNSISNFINENCDSDDVCTMHDLKNKLNTIDELINEYFDNPPLKLKELHEGMWVWLDEHKRYYKIKELFAMHKSNYVRLYDDRGDDFFTKYDHTKFYLSEVKEDV